MHKKQQLLPNCIASHFLVEYNFREQSLVYIFMAQKKNALLRLFPAFEVRNYQYYFVGQLISQIGTWLQIVAQGWLVLTLTKSPLLIGVVAASGTLPSLLFSLFGGVIVDRFNKKYLIVITQVGSMVLAFILGLLVLTNTITVWQIIVLSFLLGTVNAIDMPARQAFVSEMVEADKVPSAIALNASIYNAARVVGPSIAGLLIALVGVSGAFLLNAFSYIAAIIVQFLIVPLVLKHNVKHAHPLQAIKDGVTYTWSHPVVRSLIVLTAIVSIFGWSYTTIMPLIAKDIFHQEAAGLGYLFAASGLGALCATFIVSAYGQKIRSSIFINGGLVLFSLAMIGFSFTDNMWAAYITLFISGFGLLSTFSVINARIQHLVEAQFRGRVLSIYLLMFVGLFPVGNFEIGYVSEHVGPLMAIRIGAFVVLIAAIIGYLLRGKIVESHKEYLTKIELDNATMEVAGDSRKN